MGGRPVETLALAPSRVYPRILLPDLPQLVEAKGGLPESKRVMSYACTVNERGLRGPRVVDYKKPAGTYRIGVIGTGVSFGEGVDDDQTFSVQLERMLAENPPVPSTTFEVVNFAIPSTTMDMALGAFQLHQAHYEVDAWVFAVGVNDALPMFDRPLEVYRRDLAALVEAVRASGDAAVFLVEPVNTFYPWMQLYPPYRRALEDLVRPSFDLLDMAEILDGWERQDGLRLEVDGEEQAVVQYRGGRPRTLVSARYRAAAGQQYISPEIYRYLDGHYVWLKCFVTDVHLNPFGHRVTAEELYQWFASRLQAPEDGGAGAGPPPRPESEGGR